MALIDKITIINPNETLESAKKATYKPGRLWLFGFGAYGDTNLAYWDPGHEHLEGALEHAAEWLAENAPGHITSENEMMELYKEAADELGVSWPPEDWDDPKVEEVREQAETDLTYTESGWLTSHEWTVDEIERGSELYCEIFIKSLEEAELDEEEWEEADEIAADLGLKTEYSPGVRTEIHTWFERDRQHVELRNAKTDKTIVEWWDDDVTQAVEDGFLNPKDWHGSAREYAEMHGLLKK